MMINTLNKLTYCVLCNVSNFIFLVLSYQFAIHIVGVVPVVQVYDI